MIMRSILLLLWCADIAHGNLDLVKFDKDIPWVRFMANEIAELICCYKVKGMTVTPTWVVTARNESSHFAVMRRVHIDNRVTGEEGSATAEGLPCHALKLREVGVNDMGLYQCLLNDTRLHAHTYTHGTFLQVYKPMPKFLNISEVVKNRIILTEAILLLLCVLVPGIPLLCKKKKINKLGRKNKGEEENIYEGLNLEGLDSTYHQIQRSQVCSPYQDVDTLAEDIQLEKP